VLPARPAHPRDKPKVEVGVQVVERWISLGFATGASDLASCSRTSESW